MTTHRRIVHIDEEKCTGCGECIPACHEGALQLIDGKARLVKEVYCDGLGDCLGTCPADAITIEEREADEFDAAAVEEHLKEDAQEPEEEAAGGCPGRCPGAAIRELFKEDAPADAEPGEAGDAPVAGCPRGGERDGCGACCGAAEGDGPPPSQLRNWPLQLRLVPPGAPFLEGADILVCADCVAYAVPDFHTRYVAGHAVLVGCPKLDDLGLYREKLAKLFARANPASVTVLRMEVPCCAGIAAATIEACEASLPGLPVEVHTIGIAGAISRAIVAAPGDAGGAGQ